MLGAKEGAELSLFDQQKRIPEAYPSRLVPTKVDE